MKKLQINDCYNDALLNCRGGDVHNFCQQCLAYIQYLHPPFQNYCIQFFHKIMKKFNILSGSQLLKTLLGNVLLRTQDTVSPYAGGYVIFAKGIENN